MALVALDRCLQYTQQELVSLRQDLFAFQGQVRSTLVISQQQLDVLTSQVRDGIVDLSEKTLKLQQESAGVVPLVTVLQEQVACLSKTVSDLEHNSAKLANNNAELCGRVFRIMTAAAPSR